MNSHTFKVRFYLSTEQGKQGERMIHTRISLDGRRDYLTTTGIAVKPRQWNAKAEQVEACTGAGHLMNQRLKSLRQSIETVYREHERDETLSLATIKQAWVERQRAQGKPQGIASFFRQYLEDSREAMGKDTYRRMEQVATYFAQYLDYAYPGMDAGFGDIDQRMLQDFESYLCIHEGYAHARTIKNKVSILKNLMGAARELGMMERDPFEGYTIQTQLPIRAEHLTMEEIRRLRQATLDTPRLERVRDCFLFSCYTGLDYWEVRALTHEHLTELNGSTWIRIGGDKARHIPVLPYPAILIAKHATTGIGAPLLPMISQQKVNLYLKEIAKEAGIDKPMTYQLAVRTFVKIALATGVSTDTISQMLGKAMPQTKEHLRFMPDQIAKEMDMMASRIGQNPTEQPTR